MATPMETAQLVDGTGTPMGTASNPLVVSGGGGGGGGATGSVTAAGTNGTVAQAVQGITGGVPVATTSAPQAGTNERDAAETRTLDAATVGAQQTYTLNGQATFSFDFAGLAASGATVTFYSSNNWNGTTGTFQVTNEVNTGTGVVSPTRAIDGQSAIGVEGAKAIRVQVTTAGTGTITLASNISVRSRYAAIRSPLPAGTNVIGKVGIDQTTPGTTNAVAAVGSDGATQRQIRTTTTGALEPPTAASGKIVQTSVALTANTSTQLVAANANRIAIEIQPDGAALVGVDLNGGTLTGAATAPKVVPAGSYPLYTAPIAPLSAVTAYSGTAQTVRVTEYLR